MHTAQFRFIDQASTLDSFRNVIRKRSYNNICVEAKLTYKEIFINLLHVDFIIDSFS
jgi:hypothetical protein